MASPHIAETPTREFITPELAAAMLMRNESNRRLRPTWVKYLAEQFRLGLGETTTDAIGFYADGVLANGQHRLSAIVESGVGQWCIVVRNVSREAHLVTDRGIGRTIADVLGLPKSLIADAHLLLYLLANHSGRRSESDVREAAAWWVPAYGVLSDVAGGKQTAGFSSAALRVGIGLRWAIEQTPEGREYVMRQYAAMVRSDVGAMSQAGADLWKRWTRDRPGSGQLPQRAAGAFMAWYAIDPGRAYFGTPRIQNKRQHEEEMRDWVTRLPGAYLLTPAGADHPYAALHTMPHEALVRPGVSIVGQQPEARP